MRARRQSGAIPAKRARPAISSADRGLLRTVQDRERQMTQQGSPDPHASRNAGIMRRQAKCEKHARHFRERVAGTHRETRKNTSRAPTPSRRRPRPAMRSSDRCPTWHCPEILHDDDQVIARRLRDLGARALYALGRGADLGDPDPRHAAMTDAAGKTAARRCIAFERNEGLRDDVGPVGKALRGRKLIGRSPNRLGAKSAARVPRAVSSIVALRMSRSIKVA